MSQQGGLFWSRPPRGLRKTSVVGGRSLGEERRKASRASYGKRSAVRTLFVRTAEIMMFEYPQK